MHWILLLAVVVGDTSHSLSVRLYGKEGVSAALVEQGRDMADRVFTRANVDIAWIECGVGPSRDARCANPLGPAEVLVRIEPMAIGQAVDGRRCGEAVVRRPPFWSTVVTISVECVARAANRFDVPAAVVFGQVLAHELGHLLLGPAHTGAGIMCGDLDRPLLERAARGLLAFAGSERTALHRVLESRSRASSMDR